MWALSPILQDWAKYLALLSPFSNDTNNFFYKDFKFDYTKYHFRNNFLNFNFKFGLQNFDSRKFNYLNFVPFLKIRFSKVSIHGMIF